MPPEEAIPGSNIVGGISRSSDKKTTVSWKDGFINFSDGATDRVTIGNLGETNKYGIRTKNSKGNIIFESSDILQLLSMYDEDYNEIVRLDNEGLHTYQITGDKANEFLPGGAKFYGKQSLLFYNAEDGDLDGAIGTLGSIGGTPGLYISSEGVEAYLLLSSEKSVLVHTGDFTVADDSAMSNELFDVNQETGNTTVHNDLTVSGDLTVLGSFTGTVATAAYATTAGTAIYATTAGGVTSGKTDIFTFTDVVSGNKTLYFTKGGLTLVV